MTEFYTYIHCRPDGTPFYIGKGCDKWYRRSHAFHIGRSAHHKNIVAKYGKENILVYVFPCESEQQAFSDEIQQIAKLRREGYELCNLTDGGEGSSGAIVSFETKLKHAETARCTWTGRKHTKETKEKMSLRLLGNTRLRGKHPHVGKRPSEVTRAKLSQIAKARIYTPETRQRMSESQKRRYQK